jgi:hypothetical protein
MRSEKRKMRQLLIALSMALCSITSATAQISIGIGLPGVSIGINLPVYPELVRVPGYPVYYAPRISSNYFFFDGMYWVYQGDNWYASSWYNGPWALVAPGAVPLFILRIPVRYYRRPPAYFHGWRSDAPPRWGEHWGNSWEQSHRGWDNWNRSSVPPPAPLPAYQRQYSGTRYPRVEQQQALQSRNYRYQPQDAVVQQHYQAQRAHGSPAPSPPPDQRGTSRPSSPQHGASPAPSAQPPQQAGGANVQRPAAVQTPPHQGGPAAQHQTAQPPQGAAQREQQAPRSQGQVQKPAAAPAPPQHASPAAQRPTQAPPQAATQREQPAPGSKGHDKGPQGKGSAQEPKQGHDKGEQQGGERNR